jgi:hypothetical protein
MVINRSFLLLGVVILQGCTEGLIYTHTTRPLTTNYERTPNNINSKSGDGATKQIDIQLSVEWDSNGIGEIAREHGFEEVYYADIETFEVLFGIWEKEYVHIYGR